MKSFTASAEFPTEFISFDKEIYKRDIMGSIVHAAMLTHEGLITTGDRDHILSDLDEIERKIDEGKFVWRKDADDVHMNIEAMLTDLIGESAKKLRTHRSRNDQLVTELRFWCREAIDILSARIRPLKATLIKLALNNQELIVPGYTHLQRAQSVLLQHLLLAYLEQLERDIGRLNNCKDRMNLYPLGACALTDTGLPIDSFMTSNALGFTTPLRNSVDPISEMDFVMELLSANSIIAIHLSGLGEECVMWALEEFKFLTHKDSVSKGSNIMPQKKNPYPLELVREKSSNSRVIGSFITLLALCNGLPQVYNHDLQEDKKPFFDSVRTIVGMLEVSAEFALNITFNHAKIVKPLPAEYLDATTLADYLVNKGLPFRTSHDIVGRSVALCISRNCQIVDLSLADMRAIDPIFEEDVYEYLGVKNLANMASAFGPTGSGCVDDELQFWISKFKIN